MDRLSFNKLLKLSVEDSIFLFDGELYSQIDGMAMGSPLGPAFANSFLCYYEKQWITQCPPLFKPLLYRRYMDDCFVVFKEKDHANMFLQYMNERHNSMRFTMEQEVNNSISFLDVYVTHINNIFKTSVYRKPTSTLLATNYFSNIPLKFILSGLRSRIYRAFKICSDWHLFHKEMEFIKILFHFNLFPKFQVEKSINEFLANIFRPSHHFPTVPKQKIYLKLPFIGSLTSQLNKNILTVLETTFPQCQFILINYNSLSIHTFFRHKESIPMLLRSSLIYLFKCASCNAAYVGQTGLQLKMRIAKHRGVSFRTDLPLSSPEHSAIRDHGDTHPFSSSDFSILRHSSSLLDRRILESLYIKTHSPSLNDQASSTILFTQ
jgi:hypothetical protein